MYTLREHISTMRIEIPGALLQSLYDRIAVVENTNQTLNGQVHELERILREAWDWVVASKPDSIPEELRRYGETHFYE